MIRFVDLDNGIVYNGSKPYVFWMDKGQSTQMIYVKKICMIIDAHYIHISMPDNDVFNLLNMQRINDLSEVEINEFKYKDISQFRTKDYYSSGTAYKNMFVHMLYISGQSDNIGEFHEDFKVGYERAGHYEEETFEIAADFYAENESLKINLANFGEEIPESIQRAIYETNVHEEAKDNITLNRKYKELLLNYWNIVAARGSYKSLLDSLSWFEYGGLVKINEFWKHHEWSQDRLNREELNMIMSDKIKSTLSNFSKTTYLGLYCALQKFFLENGEVSYDLLSDITLDEATGNIDLISAQTDRLIPNNRPDKNWLFTINQENVTIDDYNDPDPDEINLIENVSGQGSNWIRPDVSNYKGFIGEETPILTKTFFRWGIEDLSLKMYLLGAFYEAYFMPIHLDLIHSTIEEIVFTNTIKCLNISYTDTLNYVYNTETFKCSVPDEVTYRLQDVHVQAGDVLNIMVQNSGTTPMSRVFNSETSGDYTKFGVESVYNHSMIQTGENSDDDIVNDRLRTFYMNNYNGVGVVVPFHCEIPTDQSDDFVNCESILISNNTTSYLMKHNLYGANEGKITIDFNLLLTEEGDNSITLQFLTAGGRSYVKTIHVNVLGDTYCKLKLYKVKSSRELQGLNADDYNLDFITDPEKLQHVRRFNDYMFTHLNHEQPYDYNYNVFYVNALTKNESSDDGVKLNKVIVFNAAGLSNLPQDCLDYINMWFDIQHRESPTDTYTIISKMFVNDMSDSDKVYINNILMYLEHYIIRNGFGFFPQHHYLEEIGLGYDKESGHYKYGMNIDDYTITNKDTLCVIPEMKYNGLKFDDVEWVFTNVSTQEKETIHTRSIREPFVSNNIKKELAPGFYDIEFNYKVGDQWNKVKLNSAFRKV